MRQVVLVTFLSLILNSLAQKANYSSCSGQVLVSVNANYKLNFSGIKGFDNLAISNDGMDTMVADKNSAFVFKLSGVQLLHAEDFMMAHG